MPYCFLIGPLLLEKICVLVFTIYNGKLVPHSGDVVFQRIGIISTILVESKSCLFAAMFFNGSVNICATLFSNRASAFVKKDLFTVKTFKIKKGSPAPWCLRFSIDRNNFKTLVENFESCFKSSMNEINKLKLP